MKFIKSESVNPFYNLALEQYIFDSLDRNNDYFMLWQNERTVVVGRFQNTAAEIDKAYVENNGINVVRRLSGGGAVYHDLGNINFTFITNSNGLFYDFSVFTDPVIKALGGVNINAESSGRNDMTVDGKKFSGNAQYQKEGRIMHHGTILFDSDLLMLSRVLTVPDDKFIGKSVKSTASRVTNLKPLLQQDMDVSEFMKMITGSINEQFKLEQYILSEDEENSVRTLQKSRYESYEWNYGSSPPYGIERSRRIEGVGKIEAYIHIKEARIRDIQFFGDYFGEDPACLIKALIGVKPERKEIDEAVKGVEVGKYFRGITKEGFIELITGQ